MYQRLGQTMSAWPNRTSADDHNRLINAEDRVNLAMAFQ